MLIKLIIDASLLPSQHHLTSNLAVWILQEQLPMNHAQNVAALSNALGFPKGDNGIEDINTYSFVTGTNHNLDIRKTGKELALTPGQQLVLCSHHRNAGRAQDAVSGGSSPKQSPRGASMSSPPQSPRDHNNTSTTSMRMRMPSMAPQGSDRIPQGDETTDAEEDVEEEVYHSKEQGWMPFVIRTKQQRSVVTFLDPFLAIGDTDRTPPMQELCEQCATCVAGADPLRVAVDRHYRPTSSTEEVIEGWVDKLGGTTFPRWQKRYLVITEKSLDWYATKPNPGEKKKITGHRLFVRDGKVLLAGVQEKPDHPKCKEEPYFYFSVGFKDGEQGDRDMYFRVDQAKERSLYINFLRLCESRLKSRGVNRNPVYWKRWVDAFLSNAADLGALHASNLDAGSQYESEIAELQSKLSSIRAERPAADALLAERSGTVQQLLREIATYEDRIHMSNETVVNALNGVAAQETLLRAKEAELGDELNKFRMLEEHTTATRGALQERCVVLGEEIRRIRDRHQQVFSKWRKLEERPSSPMHAAAQVLSSSSASAALSASALLAISASGGDGGSSQKLLTASAGFRRGASPSAALRGGTPERSSRKLLGTTTVATPGTVSPNRRSTVERLSFSPMAAASSGVTASSATNRGLLSAPSPSQPPRYVSPSRVDLRAAAMAARAAFASAGRRRDPPAMQSP
ncbi:Hypothetical protein, putative [Bodo saltans]|uniref:PH domain-containing protein n=1 Tax=Bodo saltans TaxID=75058 RepID=A0A0S4J9J3_BODSA|nr:Hypothetical protein, putative [Bodo saltans]|eukprot:CUG86921.1 Hypothetical protein, putative [Bodo saltans]